MHLVLALLATPAAEAHVPHDVITAVAPAPGLDPSRPWWLVAYHDDVSDLYRSDDGGRTWLATAGECLADRIDGATTLHDGTVVLLGNERTWWSDDGSGTSWRAVALPFRPTGLVGGDRLYLGSVNGVLALDEAGVATPIWSGGAVASLHPGAGGLVALLDDGQIAYESGGKWSVVAGPPGTAYSATSDSAYVYVGNTDGWVYRFDGTSWVQCAESPYLYSNENHPEAVRLATDGTWLALAHADIGPALSNDACRSWTGAAAPIELAWVDDLEPDSYYDFTELHEAFTALEVGGDRIVVGTYSGTATRIDGAWFAQPLKGPDFTRGIGFSQSFTEDGLVLVAAYGCGVERGFQGGAAWGCPNSGVERPNSQMVIVPVDAVGLVPAYALANRVPVRSDDGGLNWNELGGPYGKVNVLEVGPGGRVWVAKADVLGADAPGDTLRSDDGGATWHSVDGLDVVGDDVVIGLVDRGMVAAFASDRSNSDPVGIYLSQDGDTFERVHEMAEGVADIELWPADAPRRTIVVGPEGIVVGEGDVWVRAQIPEEVGVRRIATASDGTLLASTRTQHILRSDDGGDTWRGIGAVLPSQVDALVPHPDFANHPEVLAAGAAGSFRVDAAGTVTRWMGVQEVDGQSEYSTFVLYTPAGDDEARSGAILGTVHTMAPGTVATVWLRGTAVEFIGEVEATATLELRVDGTVVGATAAGSVAPGGVIASSDGLSEGLHLVELEVIEGDGVALDAVRGIGESSPVQWEPGTNGGVAGDSAGSGDSDNNRACGCGIPAGVSPWLSILGILWVLSRREGQAGRSRKRRRRRLAIL